MLTRLARVSVILLAIGACSSGGDSPDTGGETSATSGAADTVRFTLADFQALRYVEGDWVGSGYAGGPFYESYRFVDDSTIEMTSWTDSTFATVNEQSQYLFRDGIIRTSKGARLVRIDDGHHFQATSYSWTFRPVNADRWTAQVGPSTTYTMDRIVR